MANTQVVKPTDKYPEGLKIARKNPCDFHEYEALPAWVRTAVVMIKFGGLTQQKAAAKYGRAGGTLSAYINQSPAVIKWAEELDKIKNDPVKMAQLVLNANSLNVSVEYYTAYEKAIEANDYNSVAKMSQDMLDRAGVTKKREEKTSGKLEVTLNIGGAGGLDAPQISASYSEVELDENEYEIIKDDT